MFFVDLERDDHVMEIYEVTNLMHMRVKIESPEPKIDVVQFHRCQRLGYIKAYCNHTPICIKCGKDHIWNAASQTKWQ